MAHYRVLPDRIQHLAPARETGGKEQLGTLLALKPGNVSEEVESHAHEETVSDSVCSLGALTTTTTQLRL